jgi:hypothetical protein
MQVPGGVAAVMIGDGGVRANDLVSVDTLATTLALAAGRTSSLDDDDDNSYRYNYNDKSPVFSANGRRRSSSSGGGRGGGGSGGGTGDAVLLHHGMVLIGSATARSVVKEGSRMAKRTEHVLLLQKRL